MNHYQYWGADGYTRTTDTTETSITSRDSDGNIQIENFGHKLTGDEELQTDEYYNQVGDTWGHDSKGNSWKLEADSYWEECDVHHQCQWGYSTCDGEVTYASNGDSSYTSNDGTSGYYYSYATNVTTDWYQVRKDVYHYIDSEGNEWEESSDGSYYKTFDSDGETSDESYYDDEGNYFEEHADGRIDIVYASGNRYSYEPNGSYLYEEQGSTKYYYDASLNVWQVYDSEEKKWVDIEEAPEL